MTCMHCNYEFCWMCNHKYHGHNEAICIQKCLMKYVIFFVMFILIAAKSSYHSEHGYIIIEFIYWIGGVIYIIFNGFVVGIMSDLLQNWRSSCEKGFAFVFLLVIMAIDLYLIIFTQFGWDLIRMLVIVGIVALKTAGLSALVYFMGTSTPNFIHLKKR